MSWKRWIAACFGLGWLPVAPGTWGSLPPAIVFGVLMYCCVPGGAVMAVMVALLIFGCAACLCCAPASIAATGDQDPGEVVMDEFAAQALVFLSVPLLVPRNLSGWESFTLAAFGFLVFRVFDILKPGPIRRLERLPGGWGVLADDLVAGLAAAVFVYVAMRLLVAIV
jgi:phosphatidylglycerophosphatase A